MINADGGVFKGYLKKFLQNGFTILVQIFLAQLSCALIGTNNFLLALITASVALKGASLLQEFLGGSSGAFGEQGLLSVASTMNQASLFAGRTVGGLSKIASPLARVGVGSVGALGKTLRGGNSSSGGKKYHTASGKRISEMTPKNNLNGKNLSKISAPSLSSSSSSGGLKNFGKNFKSNYKDMTSKMSAASSNNNSKGNYK